MKLFKVIQFFQYVIRQWCFRYDSFENVNMENELDFIKIKNMYVLGDIFKIKIIKIKDWNKIFINIIYNIFRFICVVEVKLF